MKLIIIRHADPDYEHDSLTETGWKEAQYLSEITNNWDVNAVYCSPLGRAKDTASFSLEKWGKTATECKWLREFDAPISKPNYPNEKTITWDWLPTDWMNEPAYFNVDTWLDTPVMKNDNVAKEYNWVTSELDNLLKNHGYERNGRYYNAVSPNNDTIVFFCHFGLECVLLSHLLNISPMILWHGIAAAPSSITTVVTEERRPGVASMRMIGFGETPHLFVKSEKPSFSARFRECYTNDYERLD